MKNKDFDDYEDISINLTGKIIEEVLYEESTEVDDIKDLPVFEEK